MNALTRRDFLKVSALAGGGLVVGVRLTLGNEALAADAPMKPNAWVSVRSDGVVTIMCHRNEMGQDVHTSLTMLVAEELGVDPRKVRVEQAAVDPIYINKLLGGQITGGSTSVRDAWEPLRQAGATARTMLVAAAAEQWKVPASECTVQDGWVMHGGKKAAYGKLATAAFSFSFIATATRISSARRLRPVWSLQMLHRFRPRRWLPARVACTARRTFSSTVRLGNRLVSWNARPSPAWVRADTPIPERSRPSSDTEPLLALSCPEMRLKYVVLPAPLGPTMAVSVPGANAQLTAFTATWPPKRIVRSLVSSMSLSVPPQRLGRTKRSTRNVPS